MRRPVAKMFFIFVLTCICMATAPHCFAQIVADTSLNDIIHDTARQRKETRDTTVIEAAPTVPTDTAHKVSGPFQPNPKRAGLYAALVPGLGQIYNRQYWKVPLVYAAVGAAGYFFIDNLNNYNSYRKAYIGRINNSNPTDKYVGIYTQDQLQELQNDYNKYLDMTVLLSTVGYALQVLDAITSAHLKNFDISRDISMHVVPIVSPYGVGMGLVMKF